MLCAQDRFHLFYVRVLHLFNYAVHEKSGDEAKVTTQPFIVFLSRLAPPRPWGTHANVTQHASTLSLWALEQWAPSRPVSVSGKRKNLSELIDRSEHPFTIYSFILNHTRIGRQIPGARHFFYLRLQTKIPSCVLEKEGVSTKRVWSNEMKKNKFPRTFALPTDLVWLISSPLYISLVIHGQYML